MASKASRRRTKEKHNFDLSPPRCGNCKHYSKEVHGQPGKTSWKAPHCTVLQVIAKPHSICDKWIDAATGEGLDLD